VFPRAIDVSVSPSTNNDRHGKGIGRAAIRMRLVGSSAVLALCAVAAPQLALAADECGIGTSVTCTSAGNTYATGITYASPTTQTVDLTSGVVVDSTLTPGLSVTTGTGALNVNGASGVSITSEASGAAGVLLTSTSGNVAANLDTVITKGASAPGVGASTGTGSVNLNVGHVTTGGLNSVGISAVTGTGAVGIISNTVATTGAGATGISGQAGTGAVSITSTAVTTGGANATGIAGQAGSGTVSIASGSVATAGAGAAGIAGQVGSGAVTITSTAVTTAGANAAGITGQAGSGTVAITSGSVATTGNGAVGLVGSVGSGAVTLNSTAVSTTGTNATGIFGIVGSGSVNINAKAVTTTGDGAVGIEGLAFGSTSTVGVVTSGPVSTKGSGAVGIAALAGGHADVVTNGSVSTTGLNAPAIQVTSGSGAATLNVASGAITATQSDAVVMSGDTVTAAVGSKGSVNGATAGFNIDSVTASSLTNAGTIGSSGGFAVEATGGPITLANSGTINGAVSLTGGADVFNNSGTFNATKDSDFGAGADVFNNTGTVAVLPTAATPGAVTFTGLETFNNKGTISLVNGHAGDTLVLPGTYNGSGAGALAVDFAGGSTPVADTLVVGGAATGATAVKLNSTNGALVVNNLVVASGGAGSSATAFTVDPTSANRGFVGYQIVFNPTAGTYALVGTPDAAVWETLKVEEMISSFWGQSADAWSSHMAQARDARWAGSGAQGLHGWGQFYGGAQDRHDRQSATTFGVGQTFDLSYDSKYYGFQGGLDAVEGVWTFGLTAGYGGADQRFLATGDKTFMQGFNAGAYAGLQTGGLFAHVLAKYNGDQIQMGSVIVPSVIDFSAHTYGGRVEGGYRFGTQAFYVEPFGSFDYSRTLLDNIAAFDSAFNFDRYVSEVGKAGIRVGAVVGEYGGAKIAPYLSLAAVHEFKGRDGFVFSNGGFDFGYNNTNRGTYGHATAGFNLISARGLEGYLQGDLDFSQGAAGGGGRLGVRFQF